MESGELRVESCTSYPHIVSGIKNHTQQGVMVQRQERVESGEWRIAHHTHKVAGIKNHTQQGESGGTKK